MKASEVQKNATPSLTQHQAVALLEAIPTDTLQGLRDLAIMSVFFLTGCRVSAVTGACVGYLMLGAHAIAEWPRGGTHSSPPPYLAGSDGMAISRGHGRSAGAGL